MSNGNTGAPPPRRDQPNNLRPFFEKLRGLVESALRVGRREMPDVARRAQHLGLHAIRQGSRVLSANQLTKAGVDVASALVAFTLTTLSYLLANWYLSSSIETAYDRFRPPLFANVRTQDHAKKAFIAAGWLDEAAADKLNLGTNDETFSRPLPRWIESEFFHTGQDSHERQLAAALRHMATGNRSGWILVSSQASTGDKILRDLRETDVHIRSTLGKDSPRTKLFVAMCNELCASAQQPIRWLLCLNGTIQYLRSLVKISVRN